MTLTEATQQKAVRVLASAQVLSGVGVAGTVAAGSLLVAGITGSETFAGFAQTTGVLGSALMAIPLAKLTQRGGRRLALSLGYFIGSVGAVLAVLGGTYRILVLMLMGTFLVGAASAAGYQARFAAVDLATKETRAKQLSFVVWGSTIGSVAGPNLMQPAGSVALSLGLPQLVGPYLLSTIALGLGSLTIFLFLRPDPYLLALKNADQSRSSVVAKHSVREALAVVKSIPEAK
jgi:MFS family permease